MKKVVEHQDSNQVDCPHCGTSLRDACVIDQQVMATSSPRRASRVRRIWECPNCGKRSEQ